MLAQAQTIPRPPKVVGVLALGLGNMPARHIQGLVLSDILPQDSVLSSKSQEIIDSNALYAVVALERVN